MVVLAWLPIVVQALWSLCKNRVMLVRELSFLDSVNMACVADSMCAIDLLCFAHSMANTFTGRFFNCKYLVFRIVC